MDILIVSLRLVSIISSIIALAFIVWGMRAYVILTYEETKHDVLYDNGNLNLRESILLRRKISSAVKDFLCAILLLLISSISNGVIDIISAFMQRR